MFDDILKDRSVYEGRCPTCKGKVEGRGQRYMLICNRCIDLKDMLIVKCGIHRAYFDSFDGVLFLQTLRQVERLLVENGMQNIDEIREEVYGEVDDG